MKKDEKGLNRIKKDPKRISKGLQASTCSIHAIAFCSILCYPRYLETLKPWITLLTPLESGPPLRYRCKLCTTNTQPFGKVNVLLPRRSKGIRLNPVKHFMKQHLDSDQYVDALELLAREGNSEQKAAAVTEELLQCEGLRIGLSERTGETSLHYYYKELKLWATHTIMKVGNLSDRQHEYVHDMNTDTLVIRSTDCEKEWRKRDVPEATCCKKCWMLSGPKRNQRVVVRFIAKYYAAKLLQKRLFFSDEEADSFLRYVDETHYGKNNTEKWNLIKNLENHQLQAYVRRAWMSTNCKDRSANSLLFIDTVVEPCMRVHVGSLKSNVAALSSRFLDAMCQNKQSEPCLHTVHACVSMKLHLSFDFIELV